MVQKSDPLDVLLNRASFAVGEVIAHSQKGEITPSHENDVDYARRVAHKRISWQSPSNPEKNLSIHIHIWQTGIFRKRIKIEIQVLACYSNGAINAAVLPELTLHLSRFWDEVWEFEQTVRDAAESALRWS